MAMRRNIERMKKSGRTWDGTLWGGALTVGLAALAVLVSCSERPHHRLTRPIKVENITRIN